MTSYFDSNVFIYALVGSGPVANSAQKALRDAAQDGEAVTSVLALDEVVWALRRALGMEDAVTHARRLADMPGLRVLDNRSKDLSLAFEMMEHLQPRDALHAAAALGAGIRRIVSDDSDFDGVPLERVPL